MINPIEWYMGNAKAQISSLSELQTRHFFQTREMPNGIMDRFFKRLTKRQTSDVRGVKHITKKVRVVSLACDTPTGPHLHPTKYESNPLKNKGNIQL